jgi:hypothetical protein
VFPAGKNLANQFARRGALSLLLPFGFTIGFAAVVAEPALIAVAQQAELASRGRIEAVVLRLVIATGVGLVIMLGMLRILRGWRIHRMLIPGYLVVIAVTYAAPVEIVGLAYDSGGVTTSVVTVPLITAIGLGLANSIRGRNAFADGFGLVGLCVMVPMISVQLYGIWVYRFGEAEVVHAPETAEGHTGAGPVGLVLGLAEMIRDVLPMVLVVLFFQYVALRRRLNHPLRVAVGFALVLVGLYAFVVGLEIGLFPLGTLMAEQLVAHGAPALILLFAFLIGFATTMAEPALVAIGEQAADVAPEGFSATALRLVVAGGVAVGITLGTYRLLVGGPLHYFIMAGYAVVVLLVLVAPKYVVALAFDLGGVTTSEVTVPLITALGLGLAASIEGRNVLIDGFGLIAFASLFPIIFVTAYAMVVERSLRSRKERS